MKLEIISLNDKPDMRATLAHWYYQEWGKFYPERSLEAWLPTIASNSELPITFVALDTAVVPAFPVGMGTLRVGNQELFKGENIVELAGLFVIPAYRGQGIGGQLVQHAISQINLLMPVCAFVRLFTFGEGELYKKTGWLLAWSTVYKGQETRIWERAIKPNSEEKN